MLLAICLYFGFNLRILIFLRKTRDKNVLCTYTEKVKKQKRGMAVQIWKEEVKYIEDTPIRIILDDKISIWKGKLPLHWHNEIEIDLVLQGSVYYIVNGTSYHVAKDEIVIVDSSVIHSGRCSDGSTVEETHAEVMTVQINKDVFRYANYMDISPIKWNRTAHIEWRSISGISMRPETNCGQLIWPLWKQSLFKRKAGQ